MGVPVVAKNGATFASRHALGILQAVGLPELVGEDASEYLDKAVSLATDWDRLASMRDGLRTRVAASPVCDHAGLRRAFHRSYARDMASVLRQRRRLTLKVTAPLRLTPRHGGGRDNGGLEGFGHRFSSVCLEDAGTSWRPRVRRWANTPGASKTFQAAMNFFIFLSAGRSASVGLRARRGLTRLSG